MQFLLFILLPFTADALPNDAQQPMHVAAASFSYNYKTGANIYQGDVKVTQGSSRLNADRVETQTDAQHHLEKATAYGAKLPAEYWSVLQPGEPPLHAIAAVIYFYPKKSLIILKGNAKVMHGSNSVTGSVIAYNMKTEIATVPPSKAGRATVIINPNQASL